MEKGPNVNRKRQHSATPGSLPRKRKRTSEVLPSKPDAEHPQVLNGVPTPSASIPVDFAGLLNLMPRPQSTISRAELPIVCHVAPGPQPSSAPLPHDSPVKIHNRSVAEYQQIYHEVVDDILRFKNGRVHPYSLQLGRRIKQKLWERLDRPTITTSEDKDRLLHVDVSYGVGVSPPRYDVDISGEPEPKKPRKRRVS